MTDIKTTTVRAYVKRVSERYKLPRTVKPKDDNRTTQAINVVIPVELHAAMTEHRQRVGMTQSQFVELALNQLINMPLTAQQWWDYAPWEPMETAPRDGSYFCAPTENGLLDSAKYTTHVRFSNNGGFVKENGDVIRFTKWLELPGDI
ncbi:MAG: hypothetical protein RL755_51 [Pseudomonadota bacterium]|jgi:hypothetical protein